MKCLLLFLLLFFISLEGKSDSLYVYHSSEQVYYQIDTSGILICWDSLAALDGLEDNFSVYQYLGDPISLDYVQGFSLVPLVGSYNYDTVLFALKQDSSIARVNEVLIQISDSGDTVSTYVGNEVVCRFAQATSQAFIDSVFEANHLEIIETSPIVTNQFIIRLDYDCESSTIEIANKIAELSEANWSHPNAAGGGTLDGYSVLDVLYLNDGWNTQRAVNHINSSNFGAWEITRGDTNVIIAVIDQGFESHEDMNSQNWLTGWDFAYMDGDPSPPETQQSHLQDGHGVCVAGLIGSKHNNIVQQVDSLGSVAGIAPDCRFLPLRIVDDNNGFAEPSRVAAAFDTARLRGADIINCSFSYSSPPDVIREAVERAVIQGRNGKGCIVVASMGNLGTILPRFPAGLDSVISVAANGKDDYRFSYSNRGPHCDVIAPSSRGLLYNDGFVKINDTINWFEAVDRMEGMGYNPNYFGNCLPVNIGEYACNFGGTSASAPLVSGVVALLLSVDSNLTRDQVQTILRKSAVRQLAWGTVDTTDSNVRYAYGYGRVSGVRALSSLRRGDVNADAAINVLDLNYLIAYFFASGPLPFPDVMFGDVNCSGTFNVLDINYLVLYFYGGGSAPPKPCYVF